MYPLGPRMDRPRSREAPSLSHPNPEFPHPTNGANLLVRPKNPQLARDRSPCHSGQDSADSARSSPRDKLGRGRSQDKIQSRVWPRQRKVGRSKPPVSPPGTSSASSAAKARSWGCSSANTAASCSWTTSCTPSTWAATVTETHSSATSAATAAKIATSSPRTSSAENTPFVKNPTHSRSQLTAEAYVSTDRQIYEGLGPIESFHVGAVWRFLFWVRGWVWLFCECFSFFSFFFTPHTVYCCICTEPSNKAAMCYLKLWVLSLFFVICITSMHAVILFMDLDQYYR